MKKNLIVNFHVVNDAKWFEKVILVLKSKFTFVELDHFNNINIQDVSKKGFCHITFDDGDKTFINIVYPILKKHEVPATIFVSPKSALYKENFWFQEVENYNNEIMIRILSRELSFSQNSFKKIYYKNILKFLPIAKIQELIKIYQKETNTPPKDFQNLNLDEIIELDKSHLITVGAHTLNHPILKNELDEISENEISTSILELQRLLGHEIKFFAYPNGIPNIDFGEREINFVRKYNINIAVSTESKYLSEHDNKLSFPRLCLFYENIYKLKLRILLGSNWDKLFSLIHYSEFKKRSSVFDIFNNSKS